MDSFLFLGSTSSICFRALYFLVDQDPLLLKQPAEILRMMFYRPALFFLGRGRGGGLGLIWPSTVAYGSGTLLQLLLCFGHHLLHEMQFYHRDIAFFLFFRPYLPWFSLVNWTIICMFDKGRVLYIDKGWAHFKLDEYCYSLMEPF